MALPVMLLSGGLAVHMLTLCYSACVTDELVMHITSNS